VKSVGLLWSVLAPKRSRALGLLVLPLALWAVSCGSVPKTNYYTLRIPPPPAAHDPGTTAVVGVEHFRATEALRDDRIIYYVSPTELNFYHYHRWSADPATMLTELTARRLEQSGALAAVRRLPSREPMDYLLRGRLTNFEEVDSTAGVKARVGVEMMLIRTRDRKILWSDSRQEESAAQGKGVAAVVEALNAASDRLLEGTLPGLLAKVQEDWRQNSPTSQGQER
jgi:ABC-type uncharacterized transport system auxiliary subunit